MKLYKIEYPTANPNHLNLESVETVSIGEEGRGRQQGIIPIVGEGPDVRAKRTDEGIVLIRGDWPEEGRCLAVINTVGMYCRFRRYGLFEAEGVEVIASGTIAFGDAGGINRGEEVLAIVKPGASFRLNNKYSHMYYQWDGVEWKTETPEQNKARLALEEVERGGGEWL